MGAIASQITSLAIVYSTVYSGWDQRKHQSSESLAFVRGIHRGPVNSPHKWPVTQKMLPFDDVIMYSHPTYAMLHSVQRYDLTCTEILDFDANNMLQHALPAPPSTSFPPELLADKRGAVCKDPIRCTSRIQSNIIPLWSKRNSFTRVSDVVRRAKRPLHPAEGRFCLNSHMFYQQNISILFYHCLNIWKQHMFLWTLLTVACVWIMGTMIIYEQSCL